MKILIGADVVPTKSNINDFENGNIGNLLGTGLKEILDTADYRIFNLETPLTDEKTPIAKCGANFQISTKAVLGLRTIGIDFLTLANNHILDQGTKGLHSTMKTLDACGIRYAGVGDTPADAAKPAVIEIEGEKIGIYCCAEHEFSIVAEDHPGANPFDPLNSLDHIAALKKQCDHIIVLYHGGKEHYRYPSPYLQKVCRKIVEKGADLVVCQHSHCIGCEEKYMGSTIVYGQGNFLFDNCDNEYWQTSLLILLDTQAAEPISYIPLVKCGSSVALADKEKEEILSGFFSRSEEIQVSDFITDAYQKIANTEYMKYLYMLQGKHYHSIFFRVANKLTGHRLLSRSLSYQYGKRSAQNSLINVIECEVHRECLLQALKNR